MADMVDLLDDAQDMMDDISEINDDFSVAQQARYLRLTQKLTNALSDI